MALGRQATGNLFGRLGRQRAGQKRREPDLTSLINIVFLILIFFVVAGALRPFSARDVELAKIAREDVGAVAPGRLIVRQDGRLTYGGSDVALDALGGLVAAWVAREANDEAPAVFTIVADGRLPAKRLLEISRRLKAAGVQRVALMVERAGT